MQYRSPVYKIRTDRHPEMEVSHHAGARPMREERRSHRERPAAADYIIDRLDERGTMRALMWVFTGTLAWIFHSNAEVAASIISTGAMVIGAYQAVTPDGNGRTGFEQDRNTDHQE